MSPLRQVLGIGVRPISTVFVLVACLALAIGGCGDDDDDDGNPLVPGPSGPDYPVLSYPEAVLTALEMAYSARDSVMYKALHDSVYTGSSIDLNDMGSTIDLTFADEASHIAALASTPGLTAYLDLGAPGTWDRLGSDDPSHPDWAVIQIVGSSYAVEIFDGANSVGAVGEAGTFMEFAFKPTLDTTSPSDTLWKIVRWKETGKSSPSP